MRKSLAALGVGAIATGAVLLPAVPASAAQTEANANKIKTWERIWFRGAGGGSGVNFVQNLAPPVTGELKNGWQTTDDQNSPRVIFDPVAGAFKRVNNGPGAITNPDGTDPAVTAPATRMDILANGLGVINIGWFKGDFPSIVGIPAKTNVNVPKDFKDKGYKTYVWYNTLTKGDGPNDAAAFLGVPVPGWTSVADLEGGPDYIATDFTAKYKQWADDRAGETKYVPKMVAHRGGGYPGELKEAPIAGEYAGLKHPENSVAAFDEALGNGASVVETDVQWTKDKVAVLMHDQSIWRTTECKPAAEGCVAPVKDDPAFYVANMTKAELDKYQLTNGENIPTFVEYLDLVVKHNQDNPGLPKAGVLPEIKNWKVEASGMPTELAQYTTALLSRSANLGTVQIGSFDPTILKYFKDQTLPPAAKAQTATCAKFPASLKKGKTVVIVAKTCKTNAGQTVKVTVTPQKGFAKVVKGTGGKVSVKVLKKGGKVTIAYSAPAKAGWQKYNAWASKRVVKTS